MIAATHAPHQDTAAAVVSGQTDSTAAAASLKRYREDGEHLLHWEFFKLNPGFSHEEYERFVRDIIKLADLPQIRKLFVGRPLQRHSAKGYDLGIVVHVGNRADFAALQQSHDYRSLLADVDTLVQTRDTMRFTMASKDPIPDDTAPGQHRLYHTILMDTVPDCTQAGYDAFVDTMLAFRQSQAGLDYLVVGAPESEQDTKGHTLGLLCRFDNEQQLNAYLMDHGHIDMIKAFGGKVYEWDLFWFDLVGYNAEALRADPKLLCGHEAARLHAEPVGPKPTFH